MIIKVYESDEFINKKSLEERFVYFECRHNLNEDGYTFERFVKACMTKEILIDSFYTLDLMSNRKDIAKGVEKDFKEQIESVEFDILYEVWDMLKESIHDNQMRVPSKLNKVYRIYDHDWEYFFYVVESDEGYFGYNWSTAS